MSFTCPIATSDIVWQFHQYKTCGAHAGTSSTQNCGVGGHSWGVATHSAAMPASGTQNKIVHLDGKIDGYMAKKRKGEFLPYTTYDVSSTSWEYSPIVVNPSDCWYCVVSYRGRNCHAEGTTVGIQQVLVPTASAAAMPNLDALLQQAWGEAKAGASQILVDIAERKETYDLLQKVHSRYRDRLSRIHQLTQRRLRKTTVRDLRKYAGNSLSKAKAILSDTWMEYRYGWTPLVYSVEDLVTAWEKLNTHPKDGLPYILDVAKVKEDSLGQNTGMTGVTVGWTTYSRGTDKVAHDAEHRQKITARAKVAYTVNLRVTNALGTNLPLLGWELVPLSFVVDWFLNVPDILKAHWPSAHIGQSTACVSTKVEDYLYFKFGSPSSVKPSIQTFGTFRGAATRYTRTPRNDVPLVLEYKPHITWKRMLDATVLLDKFTKGTVAKVAKAIARKIG